MKAGLGTDVEIAPETHPEIGYRICPAPGPEAIGRHFPQLEVLELLGQGGMAAVYKARQPHLNRLVALKILGTGKEQDPAFAERFVREAQMLARLNHPNIVTLHDYGKVDGLYFLLMEYVDGVSLRQLMQVRKLTSEQALGIVPTICEALQYAHEHGVVHRDIKPENVLMTREGRVKIADFGVAKIVDSELKQPAITRPEHIIGTPHYMAPEQIERPDRVDHRADIYSLGVVFYEMLTGELPLGRFQAPSRKMRVDVGLDEIVLRALEKEPERRYQHASQVKTDVERLGSGPRLATFHHSQSERTDTTEGLSQRAAGFGCATIGGVLLLAIIIIGAIPKVSEDVGGFVSAAIGLLMLLLVTVGPVLMFHERNRHQLRTDRSHWHPALPPPHKKRRSSHQERSDPGSIDSTSKCLPCKSLSMTWNPAEYARSSAAQSQWANELLSRLDLKGGEAVLDLGSGDGKITAAIAEALPHGRVVGIDSSEEMIQYAREHYPASTHPNLTFRLLDALSLDYTTEFDLVFSNAALHWVRDHRSLLHLVYHALRKDGRLAFSFGGKGNAADVLEIASALGQRPRWREYFHEFEHPYCFHGPDEYAPWLNEAGFTTTRLEIVPKDMVHRGPEGLASWIRTTWMPITGKVPEAIREEFISDFITAYLGHFPADVEGNIHVKMVRLEVQAVKG